MNETKSQFYSDTLLILVFLFIKSVLGLCDGEVARRPSWVRISILLNGNPGPQGRGVYANVALLPSMSC